LQVTSQQASLLLSPQASPSARFGEGRRLHRRATARAEARGGRGGGRGEGGGAAAAAAAGVAAPSFRQEAASQYKDYPITAPMLQVSWRTADAQPAKRRRVTVEDLERGLHRLRLSCRNTCATPATADAAWAALVEDDVEEAAPSNSPLDFLHISDAAGTLFGSSSGSGTSLSISTPANLPNCTAIVPARASRRRRHVVSTTCRFNQSSPVKTSDRTRIAVDTAGTAFVLAGGQPRSQIFSSDSLQLSHGKRSAQALCSYTRSPSSAYSSVITYNLPPGFDAAGCFSDCGIAV